MRLENITGGAICLAADALSCCSEHNGATGNNTTGNNTLDGYSALYMNGHGAAAYLCLACIIEMSKRYPRLDSPCVVTGACLSCSSLSSGTVVNFAGFIRGVVQNDTIELFLM